MIRLIATSFVAACYDRRIMFLFRTWTYLICDAFKDLLHMYTEDRTQRQPFGHTVLKGNLFKGCSCPSPSVSNHYGSFKFASHFTPHARLARAFRPGVFRLLIRSGDRDLSLEATVTNDALSSRRSLLLSYRRHENPLSLRDRNLIVSHNVLVIDIYSQPDFLKLCTHVLS